MNEYLQTWINNSDMIRHFYFQGYTKNNVIAISSFRKFISPKKLSQPISTESNLATISLRTIQFNSEPSENAIIEFCKVYRLKNLVKGATCYKNPEKPSCVDLILTNRPRSFRGCHIIETGPSDFNKMTVTVMKMNFQKQGPRVVHYRDYKSFNTQSFRQDVFANLHEENIKKNQLEKFPNVFKKVLIFMLL